MYASKGKPDSHIMTTDYFGKKLEKPVFFKTDPLKHYHVTHTDEDGNEYGYAINGKIIGEFIVGEVYEITETYVSEHVDPDTKENFIIAVLENQKGYDHANLVLQTLLDIGYKDQKYALQVTQLKMYNKPKEPNDYYSISQLNKQAEKYYMSKQVVKELSTKELVALAKLVEKENNSEECRCTPPQSRVWVRELNQL
jgi:hypothetical protein